MKKKYSVAVIGSGRIGSTFDSPKSEQVLTHAHAFSKNTSTELVAFIDSDCVRGEAEAERWSTAYFKDIESAFVAVRPDIVVVATPDETHIPLLQYVVPLQPKLIVCEKPIQLSPKDSEHIKENEITIPVIVNYRRRFDPTVTDLRNSILNGEVGEVIGATGIFSGGLLHNGSHLVDLARLLFGDMISCTSRSFVSFEKCKELLIVESRSTAFSIFELDILTEKGRFRFVDEGFRMQKQQVINDPVFAGYKMLGPVVEEKTQLIYAMEVLAEHCVGILEGGDNDVSSLHSALQTEDACFSILAST